MNHPDGQQRKSPGAPPSHEAKPRWYKRLPSARRFFFWNLLCWFFGASALVGGILYTEHVVKPVAEGGGTDFTPIDVFKKEAVGQRVFGTLDRMNILILGIDYNHDSKGIIYTKGARSDTMMVLSLSRDAQFLNVVSIPRDTQVFLGEGYGHDKINAAFSYGGAEQAKKVVSEFLGIPIHHHLVVKVTGAKSLIDVIGGLPIDVEKDLDYDDNWGKLHIHLKKGPQVLDGEQAVGYARFRMDEEGDRGRIRRQQQVIKALGSKLRDPALSLRLHEIAGVVKETLETDLKPLEMVDLATLYGSFDFKNMRSGAIVGDDAVDSNGAFVIVPYAPENERTVRRLLKSLGWVKKGDLRIRIFFKNVTPEVAYRLADRLADAGFDGVQIDALTQDDPRDTTETYFIWKNRVSRLAGVLDSVLGKLPERTIKQESVHDDDLVIVVGDHETGDWGELPSHLKQPRETQNYRDNNRYNGDFVPRQLPSYHESYEQPYLHETPAEEPIDSGVDVTEENYPKSSSAPQLDEEPDISLPEPVEIPQRNDIEPPSYPVAPQNSSEKVSEPAPAPAPVPVELSPPVPAPVPLPAATPVNEG